MARWKLMNSHYLNILDPDTGAPTEWQYSETDRTTGKARRKTYHVPQLLDPKDPTLCNADGEIIVCQEGKGLPRDIVFFGEPTPDMEPMDEEAETISESLKSKWAHPIETLPANGGMNANEQAFMENMMKSFAAQIGASLNPQPVSSNDDARFAAMAQQIEELKAIIAGQSPSSPLPAEPSNLRRA